MKKLKKCCCCGNEVKGKMFVSRKNGHRQLYCSYPCYLKGIGFYETIGGRRGKLP